MTDLIPFEYEGRPVRTVEQFGDTWFVAADVVEVLAIGRVHDAVRGLDDDERGAEVIRTPGGDQLMSIVNESGLYSLILRSRKPEAKAFKRWVTHEVLPAIRKTGRYVGDVSRRELAQMVIEAEDRADREAEARQVAEAKVAELEPAAQAWDDLVDTGTTLDVAAAAKKLTEAGIPMGRTRLYAYMRSIGWVFKHSTQPTQSAVDTGWLSVDWGKQWTHAPTGEQRDGEAKTRVTAKGLAELQRRLSLPQIGPVAS